MSKTIDPQLGDYVPLLQFARMVNKTRRTVTRWMSQPGGLPHLNLGRETHVPVAEAREWLASRVRKPNPPRRRGSQ